jgi:hypothetical protein
MSESVKGSHRIWSPYAGSLEYEDRLTIFRRRDRSKMPVWDLPVRKLEGEELANAIANLRRPKTGNEIEEACPATGAYRIRHRASPRKAQGEPASPGR